MDTAYATAPAMHALFILNFSFFEIISLPLSQVIHLPFDSLATASAMQTKWSIANMKHSFVVIVFTIAFSCLLYNIPLRLSDSILLRLGQFFINNQKPFIDLNRKSPVFSNKAKRGNWKTPFLCLKKGKIPFLEMRMTSRAKSVIAKIDTCID